MAIFGLPGGAEWLVIGGTVLLLFFPGALLVWIGFVLGRRGAAATASEPAPVRDAGTASDTETESDAGTASDTETESDAETEETPETNHGD